MFLKVEEDDDEDDNECAMQCKRLQCNLMYDRASPCLCVPDDAYVVHLSLANRNSFFAPLYIILKAKRVGQSGRKKKKVEKL